MGSVACGHRCARNTRRDKGQTGGKKNRPTQAGASVETEGRNPKFSGLERETGLEPATPCLEGRYLLFHRSHAAKPLKLSASRVTQLYDSNEASAKIRYHPAIASQARRKLNSIGSQFAYYGDPRPPIAVCERSSSDSVVEFTAVGKGAMHM